MTTQNDDALTRPYDQSPATGGETPPSGEQMPPSVSADPSTATPQPAPPSSAPSTDVGRPVAAGGQSGANRESSSNDPLFADDELAEMRARWAAVQAAFVDDPKDSVQKADVLVSDLIDQLTTGFANARSQLENRWGRGEEASTEDLRVALMRYRQFFERLLAV